MKKWLIILLIPFLLIGCDKTKSSKFQDGEVVTIIILNQVGQVYSHFWNGGICHYKIRCMAGNNNSSVVEYKIAIFREFELEKRNEKPI